MCGIVGYAPFEPRESSEAAAAFRRLFDESRVRGTHAYGIAIATPGDSAGDIRLLRSFKWEEIPEFFYSACSTIAHARYCQSGDWQVMENNQPLVVDETAVAMNGVIHMGTKAEYEAAFGVETIADNDSEIFLQRLKQGQDASAFIDEIAGSFAAVWLKDGKVWAGRNSRRPLWTCVAHGAVWYASTRDIFSRAGFDGAVEVTPNAVRQS